MGLGGILFVRTAVGYMRIDDYQRGSLALAAGRLYGPVKRLEIVSILHTVYVPAICLKSTGRVVAIRQRRRTVDRYPVIVIKANQLTQLQMTGEGGYFVRNPLHKITIADNEIRVVINDIVTGAIHLARESCFSQCHADGVGKSLPQRSRRGFHTRR